MEKEREMKMKKNFTKKEINGVVKNILEELVFNDGFKIDSIYLYEQDEKLLYFVHRKGQGLLQFIYDDIKNHNEIHTYNWKDITYLINEYSKKDVVEQLYEELNKRD